MKTNRLPPNQWHSMHSFSYSPSQDFKVQSMPMKYCKVCGHPVLMSPTLDDGITVNQYIEFEQKNSVHYRCYAKEDSKAKVEIEKAIEVQFEELKKREEEERKLADSKAEEAIDRMIKEMESGHKP